MMAETWRSEARKLLLPATYVEAPVEFWLACTVHAEMTSAKECPESFVHQGAWRFRVAG